MSAELPPPWRLRAEAELPSTSDLLIRLAAAGEPEGLAILARRQTAGRGREGRAWTSLSGNLHLSILLRPGSPAREAPLWALLAAVALAETLEPHLPDPAALRLKWPNDLLLGGRKLAGVLCESAADAEGRLEWLVIGLGANLAVAPHVPGRAAAAMPVPVPPETVAAALLRRVEAWRRRPAAELLAAWMARGPDRGSPLTLRGPASDTTGRYAGLAADGALLLETDAGLRRFGSGELDGGMIAEGATAAGVNHPLTKAGG